MMQEITVEDLRDQYININNLAISRAVQNGVSVADYWNWVETTQQHLGELVLGLDADILDLAIRLDAYYDNVVKYCDANNLSSVKMLYQLSDWVEVLSNVA